MTGQKLFLIFICSFLLFPCSAFGLAVGDQLIPFTATGMDGEKIDTATFVGKKPVLFVFWASWCPNCKQEVPKISDLIVKYQDRGMGFLGINVAANESVPRARKFMKKNNISYPVIYDEKFELSRKYKVFGVPTVIIADKSGKVIFRNAYVPEISEENFQRLLK